MIIQDIDRISDKERYDMLADMADLYYNQGKTQSEIAKKYGTNRFRVAKFLQDAKNEQIVEIRINYSNERNNYLEDQIKEKLGLKKAIVINSQISSYADCVSAIGKVGASYLKNKLDKDMTVGLSWGKTVSAVVSELQTVVGTPIDAVQLTGNLGMKNPEVDTAELVSRLATAYSGNSYYLNSPLYINSKEVRDGFLEEPIIKETLEKAKKLDFVLSGIGSKTRLPTSNPLLKAYVEESDLKLSDKFIGSLYGYILDKNGLVADTSLNKKLVGVPMEDILRAKHRMVVAFGRHKADVLEKAAKAGMYNELLIDSETAVYLLEHD